MIEKYKTPKLTKNTNLIGYYKSFCKKLRIFESKLIKETGLTLEDCHFVIIKTRREKFNYSRRFQALSKGSLV